MFRMQLYIYDGDFLRKKWTAKSFIIDIWPSSKYPSDERNKCFSFQIKTTLKATTLGILRKSERFDLLPRYFI